MQIAGKIDNSLVNGDGMRFVLFMSGCPHKCIGCHNEEMQNYNYGDSIEIDEIFNTIKSNMGIINGITYSGGEPFEQPESLIMLSKRIKNELNINIWCYTGYLLEDILDSSNFKQIELLNYIDVLIDGKFDINKTSNPLKYTGSSNQRIIYLKEGIPYRMILSK